MAAQRRQFKNIDEYIAGFPGNVRTMLEELQRIWVDYWNQET